MKIDKKIAIVTGASRGLGAALAEALVVKGATVYGLARNVEKLSIIQNKLGNSFIPVGMDITDQKALNTWVKNTFSDSNIPDILINNAGVGYFNKTDQLPLEQWHAMINTNLNAVFYLTSSIVPMMKKNHNTCHIINIGSILGKFARQETAAYSATKYGIQGFSEALYKDLSSHKIKVSCVNPGSIDTHFFDDSGIYGHRNMLHPSDIAAMIVHILETPDNFLVDEITLRPLIESPPL
jgi:NADP-dependent 3-hydroxy acid dehydrogenase YdfG